MTERGYLAPPNAAFGDPADKYTWAIRRFIDVDTLIYEVVETGAGWQAGQGNMDSVEFIPGGSGLPDEDGAWYRSKRMGYAVWDVNFPGVLPEGASDVRLIAAELRLFVLDAVWGGNEGPPAGDPPTLHGQWLTAAQVAELQFPTEPNPVGYLPATDPELDTVHWEVDYETLRLAEGTTLALPIELNDVPGLPVFGLRTWTTGVMDSVAGAGNGFAVATLGNFYGDIPFDDALWRVHPPELAITYELPLSTATAEPEALVLRLAVTADAEIRHALRGHRAVPSRNRAQQPGGGSRLD